MKFFRNKTISNPIESWMIILLDFHSIKIVSINRKYSFLLLIRTMLFNIKMHAKYLYKNNQAFNLPPPRRHYFIFIFRAFWQPILCPYWIFLELTVFNFTRNTCSLTGRNIELFGGGGGAFTLLICSISPFFITLHFG